MKKLDLLVHVFSTLRADIHKPAPVTRYAILCSAALAGADGATVREIAERIGEDPVTIGGSFQKLPEAGYMRLVDPLQRPQRWVLTEKGIATIAPFLRESSPAAAR
jgi:DNA-binding MarR family transcriptional regulator